MANPTTNYGFIMPNSTDLVTDLPADFDVFGQAVDTQMLTNANAAIAKAIVDAKGDLISATAADTPARLAVGANGTVLTADSAETTGLKWATPSSGGGITLITSTDMAGVASVTFSTISGSYKDLVVIVKNYYQAAGARLKIELNSNSTANNYDFTITSGRAAGGLTTYSNENLLQDLTTQNSDADNFMYLYFPDYTNTISRKQIQNHAGFLTDNGQVGTQFGTHQFRNTAAIDTIKILSTSAGNFTTGTCQLYGVN
jgi:hypothetical protein